jgi:hypothetical protein
MDDNMVRPRAQGLHNETVSATGNEMVELYDVQTLESLFSFPLI